MLLTPSVSGIAASAIATGSFHVPSSFGPGALAHDENIRRLEVPVQDPVVVEVVDTVKNLEEQALHHALVDDARLPLLLCHSVDLDDVPQIVLGVIEQEPHLALGGEEHSEKFDHIWVAKREC